MYSASHDTCNPRFRSVGDLEQGLEPGDPLVPWPSSRRRSRWQPETIELEGIPPIIKSTNGNIFWADEQCTRRVGLTSTEARLFLKLLQLDESEDWNYADYREMFDNFGKEQLRLEQLMRDLPWWKIGSLKQKKIWEARVEWLARMREPRPWLLFLMARRKRILIQATQRVLEGLRRKSEVRSDEGFRAQPPDREREHPSSARETSSAGPTNDAAKSSETLVDGQRSKIWGGVESSQEENDVSQGADAQFDTGSKLKSAASRIQQGIKSGYVGQLRHEERSSRKPWEATRQDIKRQVERLLPKPTPYIVIGWFRRSTGDPRERTLQFEKKEQLFHVLRKGEREVRGWRGYLSLKSLQGFGLYKCDIARGAHLPLTLTTSQSATFSQFYLAYRASYRHPDDTVATAWEGWVHKNLNDSKNNPLEGEYSLQLIYDWSSYRLASIIAMPLLLSLIIGVWYMNGPGDVVTAWTLALYIVTAAAACIGVLAIIGTLNDI